MHENNLTHRPLIDILYRNCAVDSFLKMVFFVALTHIGIANTSGRVRCCAYSEKGSAHRLPSVGTFALSPVGDNAQRAAVGSLLLAALSAVASGQKNDGEQAFF